MANRLYNQQVTPKGYKKGGAIEPEYSIKQEVKDIIDYIKIGSLPRIQSGEFNKKFINKR